MKALQPGNIHPPFGAYNHGIEACPGRMVVTSGQLGLRADGSVPAGALEQARLAFVSIGAILAEAGLGPEHIVRLNAYVTDRAHMPAYMQARDEFIGARDPLPASTLVIVSGFTRPEFLVEIEATAVEET